MTKLALLEEGLSSNAHSPQVDAVGCCDASYEVPSRHEELCFNDGNIAVLCGHKYFLVHRSVIFRHSVILEEMAEVAVSEGLTQVIEGCPVLLLPNTPDEMYVLLKYLYGLPDQAEDFRVLSILLRLSTTYGIRTLQVKALKQLLLSWPMTLAQWEAREKFVTNGDGIYAPRTGLPHPAVVIALARDIGAPQLLPSAYYDLSRYLPSQLITDHIDPDTGRTYTLSNTELFRVYRGKEQAARYFSTFIVKELESRKPSEVCQSRNELQPARKRRCQIAFEAITYAIIKDVNGLVVNRNSDPLFAIADSLLMQTKEDAPGTENKATTRACEACRMDFSVVIERVRNEFWSKLPEWFELEVPNWG